MRRDLPPPDDSPDPGSDDVPEHAPAASPDSARAGVVQHLATRLETIDPDISRAMKALAYFDRLIEGRVGIEGFVRGAAVLAGHTAGLVDPESSLFVRVDPEGRRLTEHPEHDERWISRSLSSHGDAIVWLESTTPVTTVGEMVIERLAMGTRMVLARTRGHVRSRDEAVVEVLLDASAPADLRLQKARTLGLTEQDRVRALALLDPSGLAPTGHGLMVVKPRIHRSGGERLEVPGRMGIGSAGGVLDLPDSYRRAVAALRLTTDGGRDEPGPLHMCSDSMGALLALAENDTLRQLPVVDVIRLAEAARANPELLSTLDAFITHVSSRSAADALHVHHSTMQSRVQQAEKSLGWPLGTTGGRFRLQLAMAMRLLQRDDF